MAAEKQTHAARSDRKKGKKDVLQILVPYRSDPVADRQGIHIVRTKPSPSNGAREKVQKAIQEVATSSRSERRLIDILDEVTKPED